LVFLVGVGPRVMYGLKYFIFLQYVDFYGIPYLFCLLLNYSSCCINPIIYMFKYEEFQKGVKFILCPKKSTVSCLAEARNGDGKQPIALPVDMALAAVPHTSAHNLHFEEELRHTKNNLADVA
jgi:hypothetical protein